MPPGSPIASKRRAGEPARTGSRNDPLGGRLGFSVPHEWWPSAPFLKAYEAAGFSWVQLHAPPVSILASGRESRRHAQAARKAAATTALRLVLHAPAALRVGSPEGDRVFAGLLSYAAELGAEHVVHHAISFPESRESLTELEVEAEALARHAGIAERLGLRIALENLAPVYPGPEPLSSTPLTVRGLVKSIGSPAVRACLDIGHAHVIADRRHTSAEHLVDPALDVASVFHLHDNFGARRRRTGDELGVDPLRLDLHLPPGRGTVPWRRLASSLAAHAAPLVLEIHPPFRPKAFELAATLGRILDSRLPAA